MKDAYMVLVAYTDPDGKILSHGGIMVADEYVDSAELAIEAIKPLPDGAQIHDIQIVKFSDPTYRNLARLIAKKGIR